ncbi:MAG: FAD-binding protein [Lentisphaerae bacterium]|nr:FAD-binding protein [Lentisphaerota bacterium]
MMKKLNTLVIGSGAAGLCAAVRLHALGVTDLAVYTEGLNMGTSINTGSDKQTYYKLGMYGKEADSPYDMALDLASGGAVHGDIALVEAALSTLGFHHLVSLGVPFPHDLYGQYAGYKTDHDPRRRATSCGPYTSRDMCRALIAELHRRQIAVFENKVVVKLLTDKAKSRVCGAIFIDAQSGEFECIQAENTVFATGGPGGMYDTSVYPVAHTGAIGVALEAGGRACNLAESQFGLAAVKFRWNVSGSYMQVLPRFISTDADGGDEREFLREYFASATEMYNAVFLKGYQWPFAAGQVPGSSLIDIFTYIETVERGRRVFLDYRRDPDDFALPEFSAGCREYLTRSGAQGGSPAERLEKMNLPALELFESFGIDLKTEPLEVAVCAQHNNGGLAGNIWWESVNLRHLFPVGEVNGSHGVVRPGGAALNAGQAGAFRAAEFIAATYRSDSMDQAEFDRIAAEELRLLELRRNMPMQYQWQSERAQIARRMSRHGAFIREASGVTEALDEGYKQYQRIANDGLQHATPQEAVEVLRNAYLCLAHIFYLESILMQIDYTGSRGGSLVLDENGERISPLLPEKWRMKAENKAFRNCLMVCGFGASGYPELFWQECRPVPQSDGWFETVWREYRNGGNYGEKI